MRILWLSHFIPFPPKTGVLQRSFNLLREASKIADVHLITLHKKNVLPINYNLREVRRELSKFCSKIEIIEIPAESSKPKLFYTIIKSFFEITPFSVSFYKSAEMRNTIKSFLRSNQYNIVHLDTISLAQYANEFGGIPKILNHHNIESDLFDKRILVETNYLKKLYYKIEAYKLRRYESVNCFLSDLNFTVSDLDKNILSRISPGLNTYVVPNGVDTEYFKSKKPNKVKNNLIIVSGMNWYPNRDAVIHMCKRIWPILSDQVEDISLTVVGAHPPEEVVLLSHQDNRVKVTGFVDDVRPHIDRAVIYLCPMRDGGGTRLKILDAMSMGKPIVSTSKGCEGIDVTPGENILVADSPEEFVSQIILLLSDSKLQDRIGKQARLLVENKYSWNIIGNTLNNIYKNLTHRSLGNQND